MSIIVKKLILILLTLLFIVSCSDDKSNVEIDVSDPLVVSEEKPLPQVREEAKKMKVSDLEKIAKAYKQTIEAKKSEFKKLEQKIKALPLDKILSEKSVKITKQVEILTKKIEALKERLNIYIDKLKEKNIDVSKLHI